MQSSAHEVFSGAGREERASENVAQSKRGPPPGSLEEALLPTVRLAMDCLSLSQTNVTS